MNARALIEAEAPKSVLRAAHAQHLGLEPGKVWLMPYEEGEGNAIQISAEEGKNLERLLIASPLPDSDHEYSVHGCYDWPEVLDTLDKLRTGHKFEALQETEDPKSVLRQLGSLKIWPSENYYLNTWKEGERWQDGEFCPGQVNEHNDFMQFDGMYGLTDMIYQALGVRDEPTPAQEEQFEAEDDRYMVPIHSAIKQGQTSGSANGIIGVLHWQLVYDASRETPRDGHAPFSNWTSQLIPVKPGVDYGTRITPKTDRTRWRAFGGDVDPMAEATELVNAILDGEDPKSVFKRLGSRAEATLQFSTAENGLTNRREELSTATVRRDGLLTPIKGQVPNLSHDEIGQIVRRLERGHLNGFIRSQQGWGISWRLAGREAYGLSASDPRLSKFVSPSAPKLVVTTPNWELSAPLYTNAQWGDHIWLAHGLTPEQKAFMRAHGEMIHYAMNEGPEFEGEITYAALDDEEWDEAREDEVVGRWEVIGAPDNAPEVQAGDWGYDGD